MDAMDKVDEIGEIYKMGDFVRCLELVQEIWDSLPDPKEKIKNAFLIGDSGARIALQLQDYELALTWAKRGLIFNQARSDGGASEFMIGKIYFEKNDLENAKEYLQIAFKKSGGRVFREEDKKYRKLIGK